MAGSGINVLVGVGRARGRSCEEGLKTAGASATKGGREANKNAREREPNRIVRANRVLGQRERRADRRRLRGGYELREGVSEMRGLWRDVLVGGWSSRSEGVKE